MRPIYIIVYIYNIMNKISFYFKENIDYFKKSSLIDKILMIIGILFFIFIIITFIGGLYMWGFLLWGFSLQFFYEILTPLGFNFATPLRFFIFFTIVMSGLLYFFWLIKLRYKIEIIFLNSYFILSIFIIGFLIIFGFCFVNEIYKPELPMNITWSILEIKDQNLFSSDKNCSISYLSCQSSQRKKNFVIDDEIYCIFNTNENCSYQLKSLSIVKFYLNNNSQINENISVVSNQGYYNFRVEDNLKSLFIYPEFYNKSGKKLYSIYGFIPLYNKYTIQDYNQKQDKDDMRIL